MLLKGLRILNVEEIKRALLKLYKMKVTNPIPEHEFEWHPSTLLKEINFSTPFTSPQEKEKVFLESYHSSKNITEVKN